MHERVMHPLMILEFISDPAQCHGWSWIHWWVLATHSSRLQPSIILHAPVTILMSRLAMVRSNLRSMDCMIESCDEFVGIVNIVQMDIVWSGWRCRVPMEPSRRFDTGSLEVWFRWRNARWRNWKWGYRQLYTATINHLHTPVTSMMFGCSMVHNVDRSDEWEPCRWARSLKWRWNGSVLRFQGSNCEKCSNWGVQQHSRN